MLMLSMVLQISSERFLAGEGGDVSLTEVEVWGSEGKEHWMVSYPVVCFAI
jgi:hypothetical protein